jgi:hypothetical protein
MFIPPFFFFAWWPPLHFLVKNSANLGCAGPINKAGAATILNTLVATGTYSLQVPVPVLGK